MTCKASVNSTGHPQLQIGLTGGIGTGKSTVARVLQAFNIPVFPSDLHARRIMNENPGVRDGLLDLFGKEVFLMDGRVNSGFLGRMIFGDSGLREKVNELVHPAVQRSFEEWAAGQSSRIVAEESAILFETGLFAFFQANILVISTEELILERLYCRSGLKAEEVRLRMASQWPDVMKRKRASFVVFNDEKNPILPQVAEIVEALKRF